MKRRFRGWLILLLCVLFSTLVFAGCSTGNDGGDQTDDQQQGQQEPGDPEQPGGEDPEYTVTFVTNGGTEQDAMQYTGEALTLPEPFRYNYVFDGWFTDEGLTGEAVSSSGYVPVSDVTLYAKWTPCVYLYLYYGVDGFEVERRTYFEGDSIRVSELFTPDAITVEGTECPFTGWTYEDGTAIEGDEIVFGKENVLLLANYDESKIPPKKYLTDNGDGSYTSTGKVAWIFLDEEKQVGLYSAQITFAKGASGAAGIAFRMTLPNVDYAFEAGCDYLSAQFAPGNGGLQVCSVTEGKWAQMPGSVVPLTSLPESWQQKYNNAQTEITAELSVADYGNKFEIYIDGALAYTFNDASAIAAYEGTGFGIRCSTNGADFAEFAYREPVTVSFKSNGGAACASVQWIAGTLALPTPVYEGYALEGWYYDSELQDKVDPADFTATEDVTLYAKWTREYCTVTLNSMGGTACDPIRYTGDAISLPSPTRANFALTGWYYDETCEDPVDASDPQIDSDTTLYAGWRLLTGKVTENVDGTFTTNDRTAALAGVGKELYSEIVMTLRFEKGKSGAVGIMFRASNTKDNEIENGQKYLSVQLSPGDGVLQVSRIDSGFAQLTGSLVALTKLPAAWQEKYNKAESGTEIKAVLKVICGADSFTAYIDGELAYTSSEDDAALIASYTGTGYGLRSSTTPATYSVEYRDLYQVEYVADGETVAYDYLELNASITRTLEDSEVRKDENGYYRNRFTGWYTQAEGGTPVVTVSGNCKLYAHFERVAAEGEFVMVTFHTADGTDVQYLERGTAAVFPADPSRANYAFTGWYSDEDCTESVTQETLFEADADVYAGWRLLTGKVTENADGTFTTTGTTSALAGEGSGLCGEVSMEITFKKGHGGAVGIMFRASNTKDNEIEKGQKYLTVQMVPNGGILQIARIDSGAETIFVTLTGNKDPLTSLPAAWQKKYNAAKNGESITVTLKVVYDADSFTAYIDGELAYTSSEDDAALIASYTGTGYGLRSSTTPATYSVEYRDLYQVEYVADGETVACDYLELNASITRTLEDSEVRKDENGYYRNRFTGWYTQAEGGTRVDTVSGNCKLYAHFERVAAEGEFVTVTFHTADGTDVQYLERGTAAVLPADPSRANYAFTGWYSDEDCTESVTQKTLFEADADVYAGWRLLTGNVKDNGNGTFTTKGSTAALAGEGSGLCGEVSMEITFKKGHGGAVGIMFRASNTKDNEIEAGQHYLTVQMVPNGGILQIARIDSGAETIFVTLTGNKAPLASLPAAWQEKYNAAKNGESITVTLKVVYDADSFTAYIDGDLAYTSSEDDAALIASYTGTGYGLRSSTTPATYKVTYTDLEETASAAQPAAAEWKKEENA